MVLISRCLEETWSEMLLGVRVQGLTVTSRLVDFPTGHEFLLMFMTSVMKAALFFVVHMFSRGISGKKSGV